MKLKMYLRLLPILILYFHGVLNAQGTCYPTDPVQVLERTSQGTLFMGYNPEVPTFCLDYGTPAPSVGETYNPVQPGIITYDNTSLTTAVIEDRVRRTLAVLTHPEYGVTPLPTSLSENFYKAIQYSVWRWTDNPSNLSSASYVANNGNTVTSAQLQNAVLNGNLEPAEVIWLNPQTTNRQPEVTLNTFSNADAGEDGFLTMCSTQTISESMLFSSLGGNPDAGGTWSPAFSGSGTYIYTVNSISPCTEPATANVVVTVEDAPNAGIDGFYSINEGETVTEAILFAALGGTPDGGGIWSPKPNGIGTYTYTVQGFSSCGSAVSTVEVSEVLPVELTRFEVENINGRALLSWTTSNELNNDYFEIERALHGNSWESIGKVEGHGTTSETQDYQFTDESPLQGNNYYRLKQVDFNGYENYSDVRRVFFEIGVEELTVKVFPNPTIDYVKIRSNQSTQNQMFILADISGRVYKHHIFDNDMTVSLQNYDAGIYLARIVDAEGQIIYSERIIKTAY